MMNTLHELALERMLKEYAEDGANYDSIKEFIKYLCKEAYKDGEASKLAKIKQELGL